MTAASVARAEPTAAEKETARALMNEGRDLRDQRNFKGALDRFQAADSIMRVPTTGLEVARTQVSLGLLVEARETLHRVIQFPLKPTDPPPYREARTEADRLNDELEGRIGAIRFELRSVGSDSAPAVFVDGVKVLEEVLKVPFKVNPGAHTIVARSASGEINKQVSARERETTTVVLDFGSMPSASTRATTTTEASASAGSSSTWRALGYVGLGVGALGIGVGTVTGLLAISTKQAAQSRCIADRCPPETWSDVDRMHSYATVSTASFIVGGLGVAAGIGALVFAPKDPVGAQVGLRIVPAANGVVVVGGF